MEEQYAIICKKIALVCGLVCFFVFMGMIYPALENEPKKSEEFRCGTISPKEQFEGKILFINNCAQCHNNNMKDRLTGPPLQNWREYWADENELFLFLSQKKISKYRKLASKYKKLKKEYSPAICSLFPNFSKEEISHIATYLERKQNLVSY
jgi:cytochrome c2